jgi:hypothetical protein
MRNINSLYRSWLDSSGLFLCNKARHFRQCYQMAVYGRIFSTRQRRDNGGALAEPIPFAELELRIALLPPVSRGAHLWGPAIHAERLVELWKIEADDDVPLEQAFRLLDAGAVAGAILRMTAARDAGIAAWTEENLAKLWDDADNDAGEEEPPKNYPADPRYWTFPSLNDLLLELRELCWEALLDGVWRPEALKTARGKVGKSPRVISPIELPRLCPDWKLSRLQRGELDEYVEVRVRRAPVEPVAGKRTSKADLKKADLKAAMLEVAQAYPRDVRPPLPEIKTRLEDHFGFELTRQQARDALTYAPQLRRERGRPKSPT